MDSEPVLTPAIIFSDSATRDQDTGKLTLTGIFQRFQSSKIPFMSPPFFATVFITNIAGKIDSLPVTMNIEDSDGQIISTATGHVSAASSVARNEVPEIAFPFPSTHFKVAGQYKAVVLIDGEQLGHRVLNINNY